MSYPYPQVKPVDRRVFIGMTDRWRGLVAPSHRARASYVSRNKDGTGVKHSHSYALWALFWPSATRGTFVRRAVRP
jgi:hypothetical protein